MKTLRSILALFTSIIFFVVLLIMVLLVFVSNIFSKDYYASILSTDTLKEIKLSDIGYSKDGIEEDATVEDLLISSLEEVGISSNDAEKIINNEQVSEVVGEFLSDTMVYFTNNEEIPQLDYQDIEKIIQSEEVANVLETDFNEEELKQIVNDLNKYIADAFKGGI